MGLGWLLRGWLSGIETDMHDMAVVGHDTMNYAKVLSNTLCVLMCAVDNLDVVYLRKWKNFF